MISFLKRHIPIYINTLNIFRPFKTWLNNIDNAEFPLIEFNYIKSPYKYLENYIYTWYWWEHPYIWNFKNKWILILIDDVQYKYKYGIRELESVPFIIIRIFGLNFIWTFKSPIDESDYEYWEKMTIN